jgi:hypothetical protein
MNRIIMGTYIAYFNKTFNNDISNKVISHINVHFLFFHKTSDFSKINNTTGYCYHNIY